VSCWVFSVRCIVVCTKDHGAPGILLNRVEVSSKDWHPDVEAVRRGKNAGLLFSMQPALNVLVVQPYCFQSAVVTSVARGWNIPVFLFVQAACVHARLEGQFQ